MLKLYSWPGSSGTRVAWALEELGLPYEFVELDPRAQQHRAADYLAINPYGKVPALVDGERRFFESAAILLHLGETYGVERRLWPAGGQQRADAQCWTVWAMTELGAHLMQFIYHGMDSPFSYKPADRSAAAAAYSRSQLDRCLDMVEARLADREHVVGDFTLADIACASWLQLGTMFGVSLGERQRTGRWLERCAGREARARAR